MFCLHGSEEPPSLSLGEYNCSSLNSSHLFVSLWAPSETEVRPHVVQIEKKSKDEEKQKDVCKSAQISNMIRSGAASPHQHLLVVIIDVMMGSKIR